jgi:protein-S-isoprenylcysteine O-methyltransferase Ste14
MTAWYLPITIIPGIGMLILSTVTQILSISEEVRQLSLQKCSDFQHQIATRKIKQLGLLTRANTLLYIATGFFVLSGILGIVIENDSHFSLPGVILYLGAILIFIAIALLIKYSFRAIKIRKDQFTHTN